jgi:glycosyltransferase involved in cell wall biosynthesis
MKKKKKILFVRPYSSPFIQTDLDLLKKHFDVKEVDFVFGKKNLIKSLRTISYLTISSIWADIIYIWFIDFHAFCTVKISKIFNKKSIVVAMGYCVAKVPEINYGSLCDVKATRQVIYTLDSASQILAGSNSNKFEIENTTKNKNIKLIYLGVDPNKFQPNGQKEPIVITVGHISKTSVRRKGLEIFVRSAAFLPKINFILIGPHLDSSADYLKSIATENVSFTGHIIDEDLIKYYQKAKVYVQISAHEGFGLSLAEAMLCECTPVVTSRGSIPELVGETGYYVDYGDVKATANAIQKALNSDIDSAARDRIKSLFSLEQRERELSEYIISII